MARIRNIVMEGATGRLGGMVLTQRPGTGTVARSLAPEVTNPKTEAQQGRRVKWANLVNFYKVSKGWMNRAFENKAQNQSDYNKFMSLNANTTMVALTKDQASQGGVIAGPYMISQGSLPSVEITQLSTGAYCTNIRLGELTISNTTRVNEFSQAVIANNGWLRAGMQISFISYQQATNGVTGVPYVVAGWYEVTLDVNDGRLLNNVMPVSFAAASVDNEGKYLGTGDSLSSGSFAYVVSQRSGSKILVSTQQLVVNNNSQYNYAISRTALEEAIASYGLGTEVFLAPGYTNDAQAQSSVNSVQTVTIGNKVFAPGEKSVTMDELYNAQSKMIINMENVISDDSGLIVKVGWYGAISERTSTDATASGKTITINSWTPATFNSGYDYIRTITVILSNGKEYSAQFANGVTTIDD